MNLDNEHIRLLDKLELQSTNPDCKDIEITKKLKSELEIILNLKTMRNVFNEDFKNVSLEDSYEAGADLVTAAIFLDQLTPTDGVKTVQNEIKTKIHNLIYNG